MSLRISSLTPSLASTFNKRRIDMFQRPFDFLDMLRWKIVWILINKRDNWIKFTLDFSL
ncbi:hypothetical protein BC830DRAFT_351493 [Chytriomyces sp. MP71]|nr:hypothetical protein BC830DRAFT_351493 [Chytriomyces sp. MP71]